MGPRGAVAAVVVLGVAFFGCGDSGGVTPGSSVSVTALDFEFTPDAWVVAADTPFDVMFSNGGSVEHEWAVLVDGVTIDGEDEFSEDLVEFEIEAVASGSSATATLTLPAGTYQVICAIETHFDLGMEGILTVSS